MPYHVGEKGSYGCDGYPSVDDSGKVHGCHKTKEEAANQIYAINQSEGNVKSEGQLVDTSSTPENPSSHLNPAVGEKKPDYLNHKKNCVCKACSDFGKDYTKAQRLTELF